MKHVKFNVLVENRLSKCREVLASKDKEYSSDADRLHNFKRAAAARNIQATSALDGMFLKHIISMWDMVDDMERNPEYIPSEQLITDKLGDVINYTLLLEGLIEDRRKDLVTDSLEVDTE